MDSYLHQRSSLPVIESTLDRYLNDTFQRYAQCVAIVDGRSGCRWTYRELDANVRERREFLCGSGLKKGDRIALLAENSVDWVSVFLACV